MDYDNVHWSIIEYFTFNHFEILEFEKLLDDTNNVLCTVYLLYLSTLKQCRRTYYLFFIDLYIILE